MNDYNTQAKFYWSVTALLGFAVLALALTRVAALEPSAIIQVVLGATVAAIAGLFPIRIPGAKTSVSVGDVFVFLLLLHFGPAAAAIAAAAEAGIISLRTSKRWTSWFGSPVMAGLAMFGAGTVFAYGQAHLPSVDGSAAGATCVLVIIAALTYFVAGTLLMVSLVKLKRREPVLPLCILRDHYWLGIAYAASASVAVLLHTSFPYFHFWAIFAALPMIATLMLVLHGYLRHGAERRT